MSYPQKFNISGYSSKYSELTNALGNYSSATHQFQFIHQNNWTIEGGIQSC